MKTILVYARHALAMIAFAVSVGHASAIDFQKTMEPLVPKVYQTNDRDSLANLSATFYRIGQLFPNEWLPIYYAAYCYVSMTFSDNDAGRIHAALDKAQQLLDNAMKIAPKESEIYVLQSLIYSKRITDAGKGYKFSTLSNEALAQAQVLDENNPRIYFCKGQNVLHTPAMFGGGKGKALPLFEKAKVLFDSQTNTGALQPAWGKEANDAMIGKCKE
ncbi:MAG: hypothetical protein QM786_11800 [Breznakibacter sp.]